MNKVLFIIALFGLASLPLLARAVQVAQRLTFQTVHADSSLYMYESPLIYLLIFFLGLLFYVVYDYYMKRRKNG